VLAPKDERRDGDPAEPALERELTQAGQSRGILNDVVDLDRQLGPPPDEPGESLERALAVRTTLPDEHHEVRGRERGVGRLRGRGARADRETQAKSDAHDAVRHPHRHPEPPRASVEDDPNLASGDFVSGEVGLGAWWIP
jgi:hypothetical protein